MTRMPFIKKLSGLPGAEGRVACVTAEIGALAICVLLPVEDADDCDGFSCEGWAWHVLGLDGGGLLNKEPLNLKYAKVLAYRVFKSYEAWRAEPCEATEAEVTKHTREAQDHALARKRVIPVGTSLRNLAEDAGLELCRYDDLPDAGRQGADDLDKAWGLRGNGLTTYQRHGVVRLPEAEAPTYALREVDGARRVLAVGSGAGVYVELLVLLRLWEPRLIQGQGGGLFTSPRSRHGSLLPPGMVLTASGTTPGSTGGRTSEPTLPPKVVDAVRDYRAAVAHRPVSAAELGRMRPEVVGAIDRLLAAVLAAVPEDAAASGGAGE